MVLRQCWVWRSAPISTPVLSCCPCPRALCRVRQQPVPLGEAAGACSSAPRGALLRYTPPHRTGSMEALGLHQHTGNRISVLRYSLTTQDAKDRCAWLTLTCSNRPAPCPGWSTHPSPWAHLTRAGKRRRRLRAGGGLRGAPRGGAGIQVVRVHQVLAHNAPVRCAGGGPRGCGRSGAAGARRQPLPQRLGHRHVSCRSTGRKGMHATSVRPDQALAQLCAALPDYQLITGLHQG